MIREATPAQAKETCGDRFRELIRKLEPLFYFEMDHHDYQCFKSVNLAHYRPEDAIRDLDTLLELVALTQE